MGLLLQTERGEYKTPNAMFGEAFLLGARQSDLIALF
jgi:hypothetical protein